MEPSRVGNFKARDLITGDGGNGGEQEKEKDVTRQATRNIRFAMSGPLREWSGLRGPGDVFQ